jgi:hypothetical protein
MQSRANPAPAKFPANREKYREFHQVISLVSALSLRSLSELVVPAVRIARAVPLPSTAKRLSPTAIYPSDPVAFEFFAAVGTSWLSKFVERLQRENVAVVSFNWDLVLDQQLFAPGLSSESYGLSERLVTGPVLLKLHGSLN